MVCRDTRVGTRFYKKYGVGRPLTFALEECGGSLLNAGACSAVRMCRVLRLVWCECGVCSPSQTHIELSASHSHSTRPADHARPFVGVCKLFLGDVVNS